ncbi:MAG: stalk domain-containing protein [Bacillota bacterium]
MVVPPGRTFVPLRFVGETLGATVDYTLTTRWVTRKDRHRGVPVFIG